MAATMSLGRPVWDRGSGLGGSALILTTVTADNLIARTPLVIKY